PGIDARNHRRNLRDDECDLEQPPTRDAPVLSFPEFTEGLVHESPGGQWQDFRMIVWLSARLCVKSLLDDRHTARNGIPLRTPSAQVDRLELLLFAGVVGSVCDRIKRPFVGARRLNGIKPFIKLFQ